MRVCSWASVTTTSPSAGSSNRWRCGSMDGHPATRPASCLRVDAGSLPALEPQPTLACGPRASRRPPRSPRRRPAADVEHARHGGAVGRVTVADRPQPARGRRPGPAPRGAAGAPRRRSGRRSAASSTSRSRRLGQELGLPGQHGRDIALGDVVEQRQHLVADPVAAEDAGRRSTGRAPARARATAQSASVSRRRRSSSGRRPSRRMPGQPVERRRPAGG